MVMSKAQLINMILNRSVQIQNRVNNSVDAMLRTKATDESAKAEVKDLIESLRYVLDDMERVIDR